ncbi:hypothetical protein [Undibacterium umbellatum]|uniref:Lipoprotein n=1 Tax=Undibacterium umbellatum TaxID=2762300 RepID=A0ABR6Z8J9_9BURK|nr:hypothetical protein [Undibacterium umbellatum]MBC3907899.1 hypothetical protein [Undibacterium umbellatum]
MKLKMIFLNKALICVISSMAYILSMSGCTSVEHNKQLQDVAVFLDTEKYNEQDVVVRGFLRYRFENHNIFPSRENMNRQNCVPVLIKNAQKEMIDLASSYDDSFVIIKGKIVRIAPPGMLSATNCKQFGLEVKSIDKNVISPLLPARTHFINRACYLFLDYVNFGA